MGRRWLIIKVGNENLIWMPRVLHIRVKTASFEVEINLSNAYAYSGINFICLALNKVFRDLLLLSLVLKKS